MATNEKKVFVRKPYNSFLYKWSPSTDITKTKQSEVKKSTFCNATDASNGEDFVVTYVYDLTNDKGTQHKFAYVACDYVE